MRLLVVEDEAEMARVLRMGLEEEGHTIVSSASGSDALSIAQQYELDAILLDVMLPGLDGLSVARNLRESGSQTPILMLTAKDATYDVVRGLDQGADDYLTKPFSFEVLLARLRALSRRNAEARPPVLQVGTLRLNPATHEVRRAGKPVTLTKTEFAFLLLLMRRPGRVLSRDVIQDAVWGFDKSVENNTIDAFVRLLRRKVEPPAEATLIHTVRGVVYVLREENE